MRITCEHCGAAYEIDLPAGGVEEGAPRLRFRCSACGRSFSVRPPGGGSTGPRDVVRPATGSPSAARGRGMLLKQEGKVYHVSDLATLQRWIVEKRVLADDELGSPDGTWERVGSRPDLAPFFSLVEKAEAAPAPAAPGPTLIPGMDEARRSLMEKAGLAPSGDGSFPMAGGAFGVPEEDAPTVRVAAPEVREEFVFDDETDEALGPDDPTESPAPSVLEVSPASEIVIEEGLDADWPPRRRRTLPVLVVLALLGAAGWFGWQRYGVAITGGGTAGASAEEAKKPAEARPAAEAEKPAEAKPAEEAEKPAEAKPAEEAKKPAAAKPAAPRKPRTSTARLVSRAWKAVDANNFAQAEDDFEAALARSPGHAEATYGLGYVYDKRGLREAAVDHYCRARRLAAGDVDLEREIDGRLRDLGATCP